MRQGWARLRTDGFTLIEVLVALALVLAFAGGAADLLFVALTSTRHAREDSTATLLAAQKVEQLRAAAATSAGMLLSPETALESDTPGFADRVDAAGVPARPDQSPRGGLFARRWRVRPLPSNPTGGWVFHVLVLPVRRSARLVTTAGFGAIVDGDAFVTAVRTIR